MLKINIENIYLMLKINIENIYLMLKINIENIYLEWWGWACLVHKEIMCQFLR